MNEVPSRQPSRAHQLGGVLLAVLGLAGTWLVGLVIFAASLPRTVSEPDLFTDGIVVLTGGAARIDAGLALLQAGKAKRMFISGVHPGTSKGSLKAVAKRGGELIDCCVDLGFAAADTQGHGLETAAWVRDHDYHSLRVVTANYHMPRSLVELQRRLPGVELVPHPVFPRQFKLNDWWAWPGTAVLLTEEFDKYLVALARADLDWLSGGRLDRWLSGGERDA